MPGLVALPPVTAAAAAVAPAMSYMSTAPAAAAYDLAAEQLAFGDACLRCGGPTSGTYCSKQCMKQDAERSEHSPDFSPSLSALPALESSAKSDRSTPPSSATNSPSPRGMNGNLTLGDPPQLDLPAPAHKFQYGGHSLPVTIRYPTPTQWAQHDASAGPQPSHHQPVPLEDLVYRRKPNKPTQSIPAPLYYRERAALVHSSPALAPSSPSVRRSSPPSVWSPHLKPTRDIASLMLPPSQSTPAEPETSPSQLSAPAISTTHCGRPGCVGVPRRPRLDSIGRRESTTDPRRQTWTSAPAGPLKSIDSSGTVSPATLAADVLLSPRIRALRGEEGALASLGSLDAATNETVSDEGSVSASAEDDAIHSAFACYLFSHLADKNQTAAAAQADEEDLDELDRGRERTRPAHQPPTPLEEKRSMSVDAAALATRLSTHAASTARPTRFLFSRGSSAAATPEAEDAEQDFDVNETIRAAPQRARGRGRPSLIPGHLIESATTESSSPGNSFVPSPSLAQSPPTARRGRSSAAATRRSSFDADERERGRSRSQKREGVKSTSRSRSSRRASSGRAGGRMVAVADVPPPLTESDEVEVAVVDEEEEEERGRGRGRSRGRSQSLLRRGRGREVVVSGAGYGHGDDDYGY